MRVLIDVLTPKQGMLFSRLSSRLEADGHCVLKTTREYREVIQFLQLNRIEAEVIGKHGGGRLESKLISGQKRILKLISVFKKWNPDVAVSFSSPETARVAFGLRVPHICVNDSPHAEAVARLTVPLSKRLLSPTFIPKEEWLKFGISSEKIIQYNAIDPWVWLRDFKPDEDVLKRLGLDKSKPIITFRTEETFAAYLLGIVQEMPSMIPMIKKLSDSLNNFQLVVLPRYRKQVSAFKDALKERATVCDSFIDGPSLLSYTSIFVGAGGTMTAEAVLLGIPTFSCYPAAPFLIEQYLINRGLVIRETDPEKMTKKILNVVKNFEQNQLKQKERSKELTKDFEDPIEVIANTIINMAKMHA